MKPKSFILKGDNAKYVLSLVGVLKAHRCLLQMGVMQKKMPLKQYGLNQISFYVYFIICNVGGNGYGMTRMELIFLTDNSCISSEEGFEKHYQLLTDLASPSSFVNKYPQLLERLEMFWTKKSEWALSHRVEKITRGNHTNNYAETGIRVIKDIWEGKT